MIFNLKTLFEIKPLPHNEQRQQFHTEELVFLFFSLFWFRQYNTLVKVSSCLTIAKNCLPQNFLQLNSEAIIKCQDLSRELFSSHLDLCAAFWCNRIENLGVICDDTALCNFVILWKWELFYPPSIWTLSYLLFIPLSLLLLGYWYGSKTTHKPQLKSPQEAYFSILT